MTTQTIRESRLERMVRALRTLNKLRRKYGHDNPATLAAEAEVKKLDEDRRLKV